MRFRFSVVISGVEAYWAALQAREHNNTAVVSEAHQVFVPAAQVMHNTYKVMSRPIFVMDCLHV